MADNKEMKTLGGYEIVDEKAREEIHVVSEKADEALSLAKGATKAFVYDTYSDMISELNQLDKAELLVNYHIMIREVCVPDLWISGISDEHVEYTYTSNEDFIADLTEDGVVQVGYFVLSALETQKVDLDDYVKKDDFATTTKHGVVKVNNAHGLFTNSAGNLCVQRPTKTEIDAREHNFKPIVVSMLDYAVMKALSDSKLEWTEEQKQLARVLLGAIGSNNVSADNGLALLANGSLIISPASKSNIDDRSTSITATFSQRKPVTLGVLDYAVKKALSDCKLTGDDVWTEEEKAKALETLGGLQKSTDKSTFHQVYGKSANGEEQWLTEYSRGADAQTLAQRDVGGTLQVGTPTNDKHATTKKYVDDLVGDIETLLGGI